MLVNVPGEMVAEVVDAEVVVTWSATIVAKLDTSPENAQSQVEDETGVLLASVTNVIKKVTWLVTAPTEISDNLSSWQLLYPITA